MISPEQLGIVSGLDSIDPPLRANLAAVSVRGWGGSLRTGRLIEFALVSALVVSLGCFDRPTAGDAIHLPAEWREAAVDRESGGRFLPDENRELRRFQEEVLRSGTAVLYPHYGSPGTVVFVVSSELPRTERRLEILLEHEAPDPESALLILSDRPREEVVEDWNLASEAWAGRVTVLRAPARYAENPSFPFVRDYAPLIRVKPPGATARADAVVTFRGSSLNKVLDPVLGIAKHRSADVLPDRFEVTEALADAYADRLGAGVERVQIEILMDGGNLLGDGRGSCFATDVLVAKNGGDRERVEDELRRKAGCLRTFFLAAPQRLDEIQHVDTLLAFADSENAILSMPTLYESDLAAEYDNAKTLLRAGYKVHRVPRKTASITYTNLLVTRTNVYVPQYAVYKVESREQQAINARIRRLDRSRDLEEITRHLLADTGTVTTAGGGDLRRDNRVALEVVSRLFPDKRAVPVNSDETIGMLGSWHCLSHELPAIASP